MGHPQVVWATRPSDPSKISNDVGETRYAKAIVDIVLHYYYDPFVAYAGSV